MTTQPTEHPDVTEGMRLAELYATAAPAAPQPAPEPTALELQMLKLLTRAKEWHNGSTWRFDANDERVADWRAHREELDAALAAFNAAYPGVGRVG